MDGEEGAWFFTLPRKGAGAAAAGISSSSSSSSSSSAAAAAGAQKAALTLISSAPPKNPFATAEDDESDAAVLRALRGSVTLPAFAELVDAARWSLDADADLAGAVNMHCDEKTLHPWNLPPCVVAKLLRALGTAQNGGIAPPDGDAKLRAALCRFAVLKLLNSKLVRAQARSLAPPPPLPPRSLLPSFDSNPWTNLARNLLLLPSPLFSSPSPFAPPAVTRAAFLRAERRRLAARRGRALL